MDDWHLRIPSSLLVRTDRTPLQKMVLGYLVFRIGANGSTWRGAKTIGDEMGVSERTIVRVTSELVDIGDISVTVGGGRSRANTYSVNSDILSYFRALNPDKMSDYKAVNPDKLSKKPRQDVRGKGTEKKRNSRRASRKAFVPPTTKQVEEYAEERGDPTFNAHKFVEHYQGRNWIKVNGQPVLDWKATVRTWIAKDNERRAERGEPPMDGYSQFGTHPATEAEIEALQAEGVL